jgi:aspartate carbamoyltransferase regulatory subunit
MTPKDKTLLSEMTVQAIKNGTVIDHIPAALTLKVVQTLSGLEDMVTIGINFPSGRMGKKGVVKIAGKELTKKEVNKIAIFAPLATVNIIKNYKITRKLKVELPAELVGVVGCSNPNCITNHESVQTRFYTKHGEHTELRCHHCERLTLIEEVQVL